MSILEEFWYDNIEPSEYDTSPNREYKEILLQISRNEDKLLETMMAEQKKIFSRYPDCVWKHQTMVACLLFQNSFPVKRATACKKVSVYRSDPKKPFRVKYIPICCSKYQLEEMKRRYFFHLNQVSFSTKAVFCVII